MQSLSRFTYRLANCHFSVAFFAVREPTVSTISEDTIIGFDNVITNIGNGYSSSSKRFTAPKRGLYMVWLHFLDTKQSEIHSMLSKCPYLCYFSYYNITSVKILTL